MAKSLERAARETGTAAISIDRRRPGTLYLDGHSALADDADWNAPTWSFTTEGCTRLAAAFDLISERIPGRFSVNAAWVGDAARGVQRVTRAQLRQLISDNQMGNRIRYEVDASEVWFPVWIGPPERDLTTAEHDLLTEARAMMQDLRPTRASNTSASLYAGELTFVIPLDRRKNVDPVVKDSLHTSLQLHMCTRAGNDVLLGDWQDAHYVWDREPKHPALKVDGHGPEHRREALAWVASQMRRPIIRREWHMLGRALCSAWVHADDGSGQMLEVRGLLPIALLGSNKAAPKVPAGFFDPWTERASDPFD